MMFPKSSKISKHENICLNSWLFGIHASWGLMRGGAGERRDFYHGVDKRGRSQKGGIVSTSLPGRGGREKHSLQSEQPEQKQAWLWGEGLLVWAAGVEDVLGQWWKMQLERRPGRQSAKGIACHSKECRLQTVSVGAKPIVCKQLSDVISSVFLKNE